MKVLDTSKHAKEATWHTRIDPWSTGYKFMGRIGTCYNLEVVTTRHKDTYVYLMVCASDLPAFSHNIVVKQPFRGSVDYVESISTSPRPHGARLLH